MSILAERTAMEKQRGGMNVPMWKQTKSKVNEGGGGSSEAARKKKDRDREIGKARSPRALKRILEFIQKKSTLGLGV
jgi:hypothetical protein